MRVAIDVRRVRDFGIGTYIRNLLDAFSRADADHEYLLPCLPADQPLLRGLPSHFRLIPYSRRDRDRIDHFTFSWLIHNLQPDLTHIPSSRVPLFLRRPYLVTVHDLSTLVLDPSMEVMRELRRLRFQRGIDRAARVIAVSKATRRDLIKMASIPESRVRMIYNAPDPVFGASANAEQQNQNRVRILERYQIQYPFLLYAGHIRAQKNIPRLIEAFALVRQQFRAHPRYHDLRLIIIGDEISRHPEMRRAVIQSRVEDRVRFLGFVSLETLSVFYQLAVAFVFPSLYEGFGLPPLEAMACGTPVVTSNVSSLPEVVEDAAVQVNPENVFDIARGIRDVLCDESLRRRLTVLGRARAASFSWERTAAQVLALYDEIARERRTGTS